MSPDSVPVDAAAIRRLLPHRYPFLLVDRVLECIPAQRITALKNLTNNEEFFQGHFPLLPVMPGVLILEALAQACGILAAVTNDTGPEKGVIMLFAGIDKARFKRQVVPGDQLQLESRLTRSKQGILRFETQASVGGELACRADMLCAVRKLLPSPN